MKIKDALFWGERKLNSKNIENPRLEAEVLLLDVLKIPKENLFQKLEETLSRPLFKKYQRLIEKRALGFPFFYILGKREFWKHYFFVAPKILIPRPETEILLEKALEDLKNLESFLKKENKKINIIDVGTGTGCIIISLFKELEKFPFWNNLIFYGTDISKKALRIAQKNAKNLKTTAINFKKGNLLKPINDSKNYYFILANLPYIKEKNYKNLPDEIKKFEPKMALWAGNDGLLYYRRLFKQIQKRKLKVLEILIEIDPTLKKPIFLLTKKYFPNSRIEFFNDFSGKTRVAKIVFI